MLVTFTSALLTGCATTYHRGDGYIVSVKKISDKDYKPHHITKSGALIGGSVGGVGGAAAGGLLGFALAAVISEDVLTMVAATLGGAAAGAVIVGLAGTAVGGGIGYLGDVSTANVGTYQYQVKPYKESQTLTLTQYSKPFPLHAKVHILERSDVTYIEE